MDFRLCVYYFHFMVFLDNPFDIFDAIYCINQDSAQDRWNDVQKEFDKF